MKGLVCCVLLALPSPFVRAQSPFDGTWKIDLAESPAPTTPYAYSLQGGVYRCMTCDPTLVLPADGRDHAVAGNPCSDTARIDVVNDRTILETDKKGGRTVGTSEMTVTADGNSATVDWMESCNANREAISGKDVLSRVSEGPPGSHAISGAWRILKRENRSESALVVTLKLEGNTFSFSDPSGQSYAAKLDGTETPFRGDLNKTNVSVKRLKDGSIEETDKRDGRVVEVTRFAPTVDRKTMTVAMEDKRTGTVREFVLRRQ
ncbi:MAG TPA: hypothetical protein VFV19_13915 [Candidatus Polarisedimenticolaceae bacterium]|nr:hypothetical protein [Candidatus Polarisedimenticolaceae bacterium]